jgi:glutaredoxin
MAGSDERETKSAGDRLMPAMVEAGAIFTYPGDRGAFFDVQSRADIPEESRGYVRVVLADPATKPPAGQVWVVNLKAEGGDAGWALETVSRELFEEFALGRGNHSAVELPEGIEAPDLLPPVDKVIVYKTEWCGVCKKVTAYLDRKQVPYEAKDIEKDRSAAAELKAKSEKAGVKMGSVPVLDVGGELMVGFDRAKLEKML